MREDVANKQFLAIEVNRGNHPELVAADVEDMEVARLVDACERRTQVGEIRVVPFFDHIAPSLQRFASGPVQNRKVDQGLVGDDSHWRQTIAF